MNLSDSPMSQNKNQCRAENGLCLIITAYNPDGIPEMLLREAEHATVICADGGYQHAKSAGIVPHYIIGDFDSAPLPPGDHKTHAAAEPAASEHTAAGLAAVGFTAAGLTNTACVIRLPQEKDDTDTMCCIKKGLELGMERFLIAGGIGGRLDHTLANLQSLAYLNVRGVPAVLADKKNLVQIVSPGCLTLARQEGFHFSLFSYSARCRGVTLSGAKYPLTEAVLENSFPIGVSNEFAAETVTVSHSEGQLLVLVSADDR